MNECKCLKNIDIEKSIRYCPQCGSSEIILINSEPRFMIKTNNKLYARSIYLNNKLKQLQGHNFLKIPQNVLDIINYEIKQNHKKIKKIKPTFILYVLKKHNLQKYYKHHMSIYYQITKNNIDNLTKKDIDLIHDIFKNAEDIFYEHVINNPNFKKKSFLNYNFVLYKILRMIGRY